MIRKPQMSAPLACKQICRFRPKLTVYPHRLICTKQDTLHFEPLYRWPRSDARNDRWVIWPQSLYHYRERIVR